jgi:hypothetical protein
LAFLDLTIALLSKGGIMRLRQFLEPTPILASVFALLFSGCSTISSLPQATSKSNGASPNSARRATQNSGTAGKAFSLVKISSVPHTRCTLQSVAGKNVPFSFYTDDRGNATLAANRSDGTTLTTKPSVLCGSGAVSVNVVASVQPSPIEPATTESELAAAVARLGFDPRTATDQQLIAAHLPTRPAGSASTADGYAAWLKAAVTPINRFVDEGVLDPERGHFQKPGTSYTQTVGTTGGTTTNWAGYEGSGPVGTFQYVQGYWTVPYPTCTAGIFCESAIWVGIDGGLKAASDDPGSGNVFQAGIDDDVYNETENGVTTAYVELEMWYEYYDQQGQEDSFVPNVGDTVFCSIAQQPGGEVSVRHYCEDLTTNTAASGNWSNVGAAFVRDDAEWILELYTIDNTNNYNLSNVGSVYMYGATTDAGTTPYDYSQISEYWVLDAISLYSGVSGDLLAYPSSSTSPSGLYLNWYAYN